MKKTYQLKDELTEKDYSDLGLSDPQDRETTVVRAVFTGIRRKPRKGEWYISGAIPQAYRSPNNSTLDHQIARLVAVAVRK